jgi:nicotinate phosphoribosyltransferase
MKGGVVCEGKSPDIHGTRARTKESLSRLPKNLLSLEPAEPPYPVTISRALQDHESEVRKRIQGDLGKRELETEH